MMRDSFELKQHFPVVFSVQTPSTLCEQYVPTVWHKPAPSFSATLASCSLHDIIDITTITTTTAASVHGSNATINSLPWYKTTDPSASSVEAVVAAVNPP